MGVLAVATGAPDLLHVILQGLGQVVMVDGADVGLVDAHAEGDGGDHQLQLAGHEGVLHGGAILGFHPRMISPGGDPLCRKKVGH